MQCLCRQLHLRGLTFVTERSLPVTYKGLRVDCGLRVDLIVAEAVVVEIKVVERLAPVHDAQLLTYLRLGGWKVGLLINFNNALSSSCAKCASKFLRPFPCCVKAFAGAYWDLKSKPFSSLRLRGYWENAEEQRNASPEFRSGSLSPLLDKTTTTCSSYFLTVPYQFDLGLCGETLGDV